MCNSSNNSPTSFNNPTDDNPCRTCDMGGDPEKLMHDYGVCDWCFTEHLAWLVKEKLTTIMKEKHNVDVEEVITPDLCENGFGETDEDTWQLEVNGKENNQMIKGWVVDYNWRTDEFITE